MRDKPISSKRSPESAVTEIGVSCSDSTFFRAVTTTSSRLAFTLVGKAAIAMRQITPVILRFRDDAGVSRSDLLLGGNEELEDFCSKLAIA